MPGMAEVAPAAAASTGGRLTAGFWHGFWNECVPNRIEAAGPAGICPMVGRWDSRERGVMKLVTAVIKPFKLDDVREALTPLGVQGLTVSEVKGFGRQKGQTEIYRGAEYHVSFLPKVKIEVAVTDDMLDQVVEAIMQSAHTGKIGDGKIFVTEIQRAIRIRTRETGDDAL